MPNPRQDARPFLPKTPKPTLPQLQRAAEKCHGCDLYKNATQVVFGEGKNSAKFFFIGEQPGDKEDIQGRPFVGPSGKLLDRALIDAKIDRATVYVTNAVKHFKWTPRGKRRLHSKPSAREIRACYPWLEREIATVRPRVIICLGATAGQALFGSQFRLKNMRGQPAKNTQWAPHIFATVHPSAILRIPDHDEKEREYKAFVADLRAAASAK